MQALQLFLLRETDVSGKSDWVLVLAADGGGKSHPVLLLLLRIFNQVVLRSGPSVQSCVRRDFARDGRIRNSRSVDGVAAVAPAFGRRHDWDGGQGRSHCPQ